MTTDLQAKREAWESAHAAWIAYAADTCMCQPFLHYGTADPGSFDEDCLLHGRASLFEEAACDYIAAITEALER